MAKTRSSVSLVAREAKLREAMEILRVLGFAARQSNEVASYTLLALLDLKPTQRWKNLPLLCAELRPLLILSPKHTEFATHRTPGRRSAMKR